MVKIFVIENIQIYKFNNKFDTACIEDGYKVGISCLELYISTVKGSDCDTFFCVFLKLKCLKYPDL